MPSSPKTPTPPWSGASHLTQHGLCNPTPTIYSQKWLSSFPPTSPSLQTTLFAQVFRVFQSFHPPGPRTPCCSQSRVSVLKHAVGSPTRACLIVIPVAISQTPTALSFSIHHLIYSVREVATSGLVNCPCPTSIVRLGGKAYSV